MGHRKRTKDLKFQQRYESGERYYANSFPLAKRRILLGFPRLAEGNDFDAMLQSVVGNFPAEIRTEESELLLELFNAGAGANSWNYDSVQTPRWENNDSALISIAPPIPRGEKFLSYGLSKLLWRLEYEDSLFDSRSFVGRIEEINSAEKYLILDSRGRKRRLNFSKLLGANSYFGTWAMEPGEMKYVLFSFEETGMETRRVSWRVLPDDRSETLREALELTEPKPKVENRERKLSVEKTSTGESPLLHWNRFFNLPVSVRVLKEDGHKDYVFTLNHLSWDSQKNTVELGYPGLSLSGAFEDFIVRPLEEYPRFPFDQS